MLLRHLRAYPRSLKRTLLTAAKRLLRRAPGVERFIQLQDRLALLEQSLAVLRASMQSKLMLQENRIRTLVEQRDATPVRPAEEPRGPRSPRTLSHAGLEFLLAHARLPAPPGRILDLNGVLSHGGLDWPSLGYRISRDPGSGHGLDGWDAVVCRCEPGEFTEPFIAGLMSGLRPRGRCILFTRLDSGAALPDGVEKHAFQEMMAARHAGESWQFESPSSADGPGERLLWGLAEKP